MIKSGLGPDRRRMRREVEGIGPMSAEVVQAGLEHKRFIEFVGG